MAVVLAREAPRSAPPPLASPRPPAAIPRGSPEAGAPPPGPSHAGADPSPFASVLASVGRRVEEGERTIARTLGRATGGADLSTGELLALQAGIYRYTEALDLASKFVDRMGNGVRTLLQAG